MKILLVDDEKRSRTYIAEFLRRLGHIVVEADNGRDALECFSRESFSLILTDNRMAEMTGLELLREVRHRPDGLDVNVIIFTAYGDMQSVIEAMRYGASDYLLKPLQITELVRTLNRMEKIKARPKRLSALPDPDLSAPDNDKDTGSNGLENMGVFSRSMHNVLELAERLHHDRSVPVLLEGETGTGKELIARYIHHGQGQSTLPFVALNCAALTPSIFESELFGYEGGAFSGALPKGHRGKLDLACGGTLFLDEISEIPPELQSKLLRVIQEKEYYRVGGLKIIQTDVRLICAANQRLEQLVERGLFRADLFYRLNVGRIYLPPLRQRKEEILPLALMFLNDLAEKKNKKCKSISDSAARILMDYRWPGNIRELRNLMEWLTLRYDDQELQPFHLDKIFDSTERTDLLAQSTNENNHNDIDLPQDSMPLADISNAIIIKALEMHRGNKTETAKYLGISRSSLYYRLKHI